MTGQKQSICPYCQSIIHHNEETIICPECNTVHHRECWDENHGCTRFGCKMSNQVSLRDEKNLLSFTQESTFETPRGNQSIIDGYITDNVNSSNFVSNEPSVKNTISNHQDTSNKKGSFCTQCGTFNQFDYRFCINCGHPIIIKNFDEKTHENDSFKNKMPSFNELKSDFSDK